MHTVERYTSPYAENQKRVGGGGGIVKGGNENVAERSEEAKREKRLALTQAYPRNAKGISRA